MEILLGLGSALTYGAADFVGGVVTRRNDVFVVVLLSQAIGAVPLALIVALSGGDPTAEALMWGFLSGIGGGIGVTLLFAGLAVGRMSVVAPVTAVEAATIPAVFGMLTGERPSAVAIAGIVLALVAVALISAAPEPGAPDGGAGTDDPTRKRAPVAGLPQAVGAGIAFGAFFILLAEAGEGSGLWPIAAARVASISLVGIAVLIRKPKVRVDKKTAGAIGLSGSLDVAANVLYLLATRSGLLSLVAVLTSMYPASTVLLARVVLDERLLRIQTWGLVLAAGAITMIASG